MLAPGTTVQLPQVSANTVSGTKTTCVAGHIKRLILSRDPPFGFIKRNDGGPDLFFNEGLLGDGQTWASLVSDAQEHDLGTIPVTFIPAENSDGRPQAKGVIVLHPQPLQVLEEDVNDATSMRERMQSLHEHFDPNYASRQDVYQCIKKEKAAVYQRHKDEAETATKRRAELFNQHTAAEDQLWEKCSKEKEKANTLYDEAQRLWESSKIVDDAEHTKQEALRVEAQRLWDSSNQLWHEENARVKALRDEADQLWECSQQLWNAGGRDRAKEMQARSKELQTKAKQLSAHEKVQQMQTRAKELQVHSKQHGGACESAKEMRARAKQLQDRAKEHRMKAHHWRQRVMELDWQNNEEMFEHVMNNEHDGRVRDGTWIDLHGLSADFAEAKTLKMLLQSKNRGVAQVEVITGMGNHSGKQGPVVPQRILELLRTPPKCLHGLTFTAESPGAYIVCFH